MSAVHRILSNNKKQVKYTRFLLNTYKKTIVKTYIKLHDYGDIKYEILLPLMNNFILNIFKLCIVNTVNLDIIKNILEHGTNIIIDYICISHDNTNKDYEPKYNNAISFAYQKTIYKLKDIYPQCHSNPARLSNGFNKNTTQGKHAQTRDKRRSKTKYATSSLTDQTIKNNSYSNNSYNTRRGFRPFTPEPTTDNIVINNTTYSDINDTYLMKNMKMLAGNKSIRAFISTLDICTCMCNILVAKLFETSNNAITSLSKYGFYNMQPILDILYKDFIVESVNKDDDLELINISKNDEINTELVDILSNNIDRIILYISIQYNSILKIANSGININNVISVLNSNAIECKGDLLFMMSMWYIYIRIIENVNNNVLIPSHAILKRIQNYLLYKLDTANIIKKHYHTTIICSMSDTKKEQKTLIHAEFFNDIYSLYRSYIKQAI